MECRSVPRVAKIQFDGMQFPRDIGGANWGNGMTTRTTLKILAAIFCLGTMAAFPAVTSNETPKFDELYRLLRSNLKSISAEELDRAASRGLLEQLHSQVVLVANANSPSAGSS